MPRFTVLQCKTVKNGKRTTDMRSYPHSNFFFFFFEKGFVMSMERGRGRLKNGDPGASHDIEA